MMRRCLLVGCVFAALSSTVAQAGGWPRLCLPLDGVTDGSAEDCRQLIQEELDLRLTPTKMRRNAVEIVKENGQWYVAMYLMKNIGLREVENALEGSEFSLAQEKLRLFGHAYLIVQAPKKAHASLVADLKEVPNVSVSASKAVEDGLQITIDMPYPQALDNNRESLKWGEFHWGDFSSDQSRRQRKPITGDDLPSYRLLQQVTKMHGGTLENVAWGMPWGCRPLGGVAETE